jgi:thioredoxin reductase (NADPH)
LKELKTDLIIIGAGPAGLGAAIYAARSALKFSIFDRVMAGGQIITTEYIENYPGFREDISGFDLMQNIIEHCKKFGIVPEEYKQIDSLKLQEESGFSKYKFKCTGEDLEAIAKAVIIATGARPTRLYVEGESEYTGKGISYCATCDGALYYDKEVIVAGGGNAAIQEALFLTKFAKKVYVVHRRNELRAVKTLQNRAFENGKIEFIWDSVIEKFSGAERLEEVLIKNVKNGRRTKKKIDGVFEYIGIKANSQLVEGIAELDENGFIITDSSMSTAQKGLFAAGDVRNTRLRQVITAVADGAIAATFADKHLDGLL